MSGFDVLDPNLDLSQNYFIEASAGTGKTFAIENIIIRLLKMPDGPSIEEIAAITFTRHATGELKARIRKNIEKALLEEKEPSIKIKLSNALSSFDNAKIFTIHGFCLFALKEFSIENALFFSEKERYAAPEISYQIFKDFLRTEVNDLIHIRQLEKILKLNQNDMEALVKKLAKLAQMRIPIRGFSSFSEIYQRIEKEVLFLKESFSIEKEKIYEDFTALAPGFKKLLDRQKNLKPEILQGFQRGALLFERMHDDFLDLPLLMMTVDNAVKKEISLKKPLFYPHLLQEMQKRLFPLLKEASDSLSILGLLAEKGRQFFEKVIEKEEIVFFEDLIRKMHQAVKTEDFSQSVRKSFKAVLIDEFQDTDKMQWEIFSKLFFHPEFKGPFILVGDPKQSIYYFRGADLYTYSEAKKAFGSAHQRTLTHNYRSQPGLVEALNHLFSKDFLFLPKTGEKIECPPVISACTEEGIMDDKGSIHFVSVQNEKSLFSFIINEIHRLHNDFGFSFGSFAVLVKDRFQEKRFLDVCPLPTLSRPSELSESAGVQLLQDLFRVALNPLDRSFAAIAFGGPLFNLKTTSEIEEMRLEMTFARELLQKRGAVAFFNFILQKAVFCDEKTYLEMQKIIELIATKTSKIEEILPFFQKLKDYQESESSFLFQREENALTVMTMHGSKGLEFPIVFPIGLSISHSERRDFIRDGEELVLQESSEELQAEKMRMLYVALTRAKKRVYLPLIEKEEKSPLQVFLKDVYPNNLKNWNLDCAKAPGLNGRKSVNISNIDRLPITQSRELSLQPKSNSSSCLGIKALYKASPEITFSDWEDQPYFFTSKTPLLFAPKASSLSFTPSAIHSYTTLYPNNLKNWIWAVAKGPGLSDQRPLNISNIDQLPIIQSRELLGIAKKESPLLKEQMTKGFPSGKETGILLHHVFEKLDFQNISSYKEQAAFLLKNTFLEPWIDQVFEMITRTLNMPLQGKKGPFCLSEVDPSKMIKEMEFLYPEGDNYLKGYIDLFFEYRGDFYAVDWKSNDLGGDYSENRLREEIKNYQYDLQAKIYESALRRYLAIFGRNDDFQGFFYIFLKGNNYYLILS